MQMHTLGTSSVMVLFGTRKRGKHKDKTSWIIGHDHFLECHVGNPVQSHDSAEYGTSTKLQAENTTHVLCTLGDKGSEISHFPLHIFDSAMHCWDKWNAK